MRRMPRRRVAQQPEAGQCGTDLQRDSSATVLSIENDIASQKRVFEEKSLESLCCVKVGDLYVWLFMQSFRDKRFTEAHGTIEPNSPFRAKKTENFPADLYKDLYKKLWKHSQKSYF